MKFEPLGVLPEATPEDIAALRRVRKVRLNPRQLRLMMQSLPHLESEELAKRPVFKGEEFSLP